jgi:hypothetical protein
MDKLEQIQFFQRLHQQEVEVVQALLLVGLVLLYQLVDQEVEVKEVQVIQGLNLEMVIQQEQEIHLLFHHLKVMVVVKDMMEELQALMVVAEVELELLVLLLVHKIQAQLVEQVLLLQTHF